MSNTNNKSLNDLLRSVQADAKGDILSQSEVERLLQASKRSVPVTQTTQQRLTNNLYERLLSTPLKIGMTAMTTAACITLGLIAFWPQTNSQLANKAPIISHGVITNGSNLTQLSHITTDTTELSQLATPTSASTKNEIKLRKTDDPRGPWSAGNDQFYADLSREELAKLGIVIAGTDTVSYYDLQSLAPSRELPDAGKPHFVEHNQMETVESKADPKEEHFQRMTLTPHLNSLEQIFEDAIPSGIKVPRFFPVLITNGGGNNCEYRYHDGNMSGLGSLGQETKEIMAWREWLNKPAIKGYRAMGYTTEVVTTSPCKGCSAIEYDTITLRIGKDLPDRPYPKAPAGFDLTDAQQKRFVQLMHYYEGSDVMPDVKWPDNLSIKVDTITAQDFRNELDSEENSSAMQRGRAIFSRIHELVPVLIRRNGGTGTPDSSDYIFWYEPTDELFNALPPAQASIFREKLAEPPHCISMPNEVLKSAEITYCEAEPQEVQVTVQDLTGKWLIIMDQLASAGDNILQFPTETLPTGMYIVTVRDHDSTTRSQRLWVENAHPIRTKDENWKSNSPHSPDQLLFINNGEDRTALDSSIAEDHPGWLNIPSLELNTESLAKLGIESDTQLVAYYRHGDKPNVVIYWGIMRNGFGMTFNTLDRDSVTSVNVPSFEPTIITDGRGRCSKLPPGDSTEQLKAIADIDKLLPILVRENTVKDSITKRDLIFWYQPTPEFLALLPDSARAVAQRMMSGATNTPASVTDVHGAIQSAGVFPNPSKGRFSVSISLSASRNITITLRNLLGQQVAAPVEAGVNSSSTNVANTLTQSLDFSTVPQGVYLLEISSDQGERYIERVVVTK
jgi:hypothetical protein